MKYRSVTKLYILTKGYERVAFNERIPQMLGIEHPIVQMGRPTVRGIWVWVKLVRVTIFHNYAAVRHALCAKQAGCAMISIESFQSAAHSGEDDIPRLILIPAAADRGQDSDAGVRGLW